MIQNRIFFSRRGIKAATQVGVFLCLIICLLFLAKPINAATSGNIAGKIFQDLNTNGVLDIGEEGLSGWQVSILRDSNAVRTVTTDSAGYYGFKDLKSGDYLVKLEIPATWAAVSGKEISINLKLGEKANVDFPSYQLVADNESYSPIMDISNYSVKIISPIEARLTWFTNYSATGQVVFSKGSVSANKLLAKNSNFGYSNSTAVDFAEKTYHTITIDDLEPDTTYYFRMVSVPNPRQWRGAPYLLTYEYSFTTDPLPPVKEETAKEDDKAVPIGKELWPDGKGRVLATDFDGSDLETSEEDDTATPTTTDEITIIEEKDEDEKEPAAVSTQCAIYIWILLILNLIATIFVWMKNKTSTSPAGQKLWWIILILVLVPVIMGYPACWLTIWLLFILILVGVYLFNSKKKSNYPPVAGGGSNDPADKPYTPASTPNSSSDFSVRDSQTDQNNSSDSYKPSTKPLPSQQSSILEGEPVKSFEPAPSNSDFFFKPDSPDPPLNSEEDRRQSPPSSES